MAIAQRSPSTARSARVRLAGALLLVLTFLAPPAFAEVLWRGDFETGDISQWTKTQSVSADRLRVVSDPVVQGRHAVQVSVRQGDDPISSSGNRNELVYTGEIPERGERVYRWSTLWPASYQSPAVWQIFTQWHQVDGGGPPPVAFVVNGETLYFDVGGARMWETALERAKWHEFILHVFWSTDPNEGYVELYYDGQLVVPRTSVATAFEGGGGNYLKQGLYRKDEIAFEQVLFHDGMTVATSLADVLPPPAPVANTTADTLAQEPNLAGKPASAAPAEDVRTTLATLATGEQSRPLTAASARGCASVAAGAPLLLGLVALLRRTRRSRG